MSDAPLIYRWTGEAMEPITHHTRAANERFIVGMRYTMEEVQHASDRSRGHYFAALREAWQNLPDHLVPEFPSVDHLRKRALIETGHYLERRLVTASAQEARKLLTFLAPTDEFAVYSINGGVVIERKARSQKRKAMGSATFQQSKDDVLAWCAKLIGVKQSDLERAA